MASLRAKWPDHACLVSHTRATSARLAKQVPNNRHSVLAPVLATSTAKFGTMASSQYIGILCRGEQYGERDSVRRWMELQDARAAITAK